MPTSDNELLLQERLEKMRDVEKEIYSQAVVEMRKIIEHEVKEIKRLSGLTMSSSQEEELDRQLGIRRSSSDTSSSPDRDWSHKRIPRYPSQDGEVKKSPSQDRVVRMRVRRRSSQDGARGRRSREGLGRPHSQESLTNGLSPSHMGSRESSMESFGWHSGSGSGEPSLEDLKGAVASQGPSDNLRSKFTKQSSLEELKQKLALVEDKHDAADKTLSPDGSFRSSQSEETLQDISLSMLPKESFDLSDDLLAGPFPQSDSKDSLTLDASEIAELVLDDKILSECSSIPPMDEYRDEVLMDQSLSDASVKMTASDIASDIDSRKMSESECSAVSDKVCQFSLIFVPQVNCIELVNIVLKY